MKRSPLKRKTPLGSNAGAKKTATPAVYSSLPAPAKAMLRARPKSTPARRAAAGKPCLVRIPGVCNHDTATVVLAHYRLAGYAGTSLKPPDEMGAWACSSCHDAIDARTETPYARDQLRLMHAEGVLRTQQENKQGNNDATDR